MGLAEDKAALRAQMREARKALTPQQRKAGEDAIAERLYSLPTIRKAKTIAVYQAVGSEASVNDLVRALRLLDDKPRIAYPAVCGGGVMQFIYVEAGETPDFLCDPFGKTAPRHGDSVAEKDDIDIILVPGLAFDEKCRRLGQGGGYYDRFLDYMHGECLAIGVAFDEQIVDAVPCDVHDRRVDYVVTPTHAFTR